MKKKQILEAWRNEEYYLSLSEEERAGIPEHPSGLLDIEDDVLRTIAGGCGPGCTSAICTPCPPVHCY
ncbi:MAG TPA: mersacidin/lichenicidin family type 2 lantibiotic [Thermoanaerobaculia bacterium]|nr:mersacidin/lichenicidin family type 2 lantibiotic [Thermoanaerobaculia bacterium]